MSDNHTHNMKDAVSQFLKSQNLEQPLNEKKLILMWNDVMGLPIAKRTTKVNIHNRIMYVTLSSAPLKQELTQSKAKVMEIIETKIGANIIDDIRFF